jgi:hypothetical protein
LEKLKFLINGEVDLYIYIEFYKMSAQLTIEPKHEQSFLSIITEQKKISITDEIICGKKLKFNYINGDKLIQLLDNKNIPKEGLTYLSILKYNFDKIINQLVEYFPDIKINKFYNSPCMTECKIKREEFTYKYDIYIVMTKNDKIYEYGFDFFFNLSDIPENKYSHSKTLLDDYQYFINEDIETNDDIKRYLNENLFKILIAICALKDDEYQLAEIMFVKSNQENKTQKQILKELGYFLRVINWKKSNDIDLEDLFDSLMLEDNETKEQINKKQFLKIINEICTDKKIIFSSKQKNINHEIFEMLLMNINSHNSQMLQQYRDIYLKAMSMLMNSLKIIIELVKEINMKKTFTPDYINNFIEFHLDEYKEQNIFNKIYYEKINEKKILFENLFKDINAYCNKNKHNEDKLDKIKFDFDLLYDNVFNV